MSEGDFNDEVDRLVKLHRVFDKYHKFTTNTSEKMIFEILDSENIKWDEVSFISDLPLFIMEEFDNQLDWSALMFNRKMDDEMIKKFENRIKFAMVSGEFLTKITDRHLSVVRIALKANFEMLSDIFTYACSNNYINIVNDLIVDTRIKSELFKELFNKVCAYGSDDTILKLLIKDKRIIVKSIINGFEQSRTNRNSYNADILLEELCIHVENITTNILEEIPYLTKFSADELFIYACKFNRINAIKIMLSDIEFTMKIIHIGFIHTCDYDSIDVFKYLHKHKCTTLELITRGLNIACRYSCVNILETMLTYDYGIDVDVLNYQLVNAYEYNFIGDIMYKFLKLMNNRLTPYSIDRSFTIACKNGHIDIINYLIDDTNVHAYSIYDGFQKICENGFIDAVRLLVGNNRIKAKEVDGGFKSAIMNNHIDILTLLAGDDRVNVHTINNGCWESYGRNNIDIVKVLIKNKRITLNIINSIHNHINKIIYAGNDNADIIDLSRIILSIKNSK